MEDGSFSYGDPYNATADFSSIAQGCQTRQCFVQVAKVQLSVIVALVVLT